MGRVRARTKSPKKLSPQEIDRLVVAQAGDDTAWAEPVRVRMEEAAAFSIPGDLAARAAFLARLHHQATMQEWLARIIRERVELEEAAFAAAWHDHSKGAK